MMCDECDCTPPWDDEDLNVCPNCGSEWREKTLSDVDWPLTVQAGPRLNIASHVRPETDGEAAFEAFPSNAEHLTDLEVHQNGIFRVVSEG